MQVKQTIIYVNFSQYDNTGRILDYLIKNFSVVIQFSFDHLRLKNGRKTNFLMVYEQGIMVEKKRLASVKTPSMLLFPSLPLVGMLMIAQSIYYSWRMRQKYEKFDYYISVNGFSSWIGLVLKQLSICDKTIFWVWDYFPLQYPDWRIRIARWVYWKFDLTAIMRSDKVVFTNRRLYNYFKKTITFSPKQRLHIVPIGSNRDPQMRIPLKTPVIGFLGMIKEHQGIDLCARNMDKLIKMYPDIIFEIVGSGPDEMILKQKTRHIKKHMRFYGFIEDQNVIKKIIRRWSVGIATYLPVASNESYWGDPSKIKTYFGMGIPVVTTNVSYFSDEIRKHNAGIIIEYDDKEFVQAIKELLRRNKTFSRNAFFLSAQYDYKKLYPKLFGQKYPKPTMPMQKKRIQAKTKRKVRALTSVA